MKIFSGAFRKGVVMEQYKEPALSRDIKQIFTKTASILSMEPYGSIGDISAKQIIEVAMSAKIVDEHDGHELWRKLKRAKKGATILVDALDDQPYVCSQMGPMLHRREECVGGLELALKAIGSEKAQILVYKNLSSLEIKIPSKIGGIPIKRIGGAYPAELYSNMQYAEGADGKYLTLGACALIHLHRAVYECRVQTTTFITVAGNCVSSPRNLEVDIGSTAAAAFHQCGLMDEPTRIVAGGSLTGQSIDDTESYTVDTCTRALLAFREDERDRHFECIGCGRCIRSCPAGLNPMLLYKTMSAGLFDECARLDPQRCIGCMTCSYVCCAKLDIAAAIEKYVAKGGVRQ